VIARAWQSSGEMKRVYCGMVQACERSLQAGTGVWSQVGASIDTAKRRYSLMRSVLVVEIDSRGTVSRYVWGRF
jgi:hypothetical protein